MSYSAHNTEVVRVNMGVLPLRLSHLASTVYGSDQDNKQVWIDHYVQHNTRATSSIPADKLLVMDLTKGEWMLVLPCRACRYLLNPCK